MWEEVLLGEGGEECSLSTSFLRFKAMVLLVGQFEANCYEIQQVDFRNSLTIKAVIFEREVC